MVKKLLDMMKFRNECPAFDGSFELLPCADDSLHIRRQNGNAVAELKVNFKTKSYEIFAGENGDLKLVDAGL